MKLILLLLVAYCSLLTNSVKSQTLQVVEDNELLDLFRTENYVVVLFSKCRQLFSLLFGNQMFV